MKITNAYCAYEPEKFKHAFGFKGSTLSGVWQTVVALKSGDEVGVGLGIQSVLWSDSSVFAEFGEQRGNELMFAVTEYAVKAIAGKDFDKVPDIVHSVFDDCYAYAKKIVGRDDVTETFVLNALVPLDMAAWQLYARLEGLSASSSLPQKTSAYSFSSSVRSKERGLGDSTEVPSSKDLLR